MGKTDFTPEELDAQETFQRAWGDSWEGTHPRGVYCGASPDGARIGFMVFGENGTITRFSLPAGADLEPSGGTALSVWSMFRIAIDFAAVRQGGKRLKRSVLDRMRWR